MDGGTVLAAGAVLRRADGRIALVHRPKYDDWTLPKGKLEPGESDEEAAIREVWEETGHHGRIAGDLGETRYTVVRDGVERPKRVRYFLMDVTGGSFEPHAEVDELEWVTAEEARERLSYDRDRDVVGRGQDGS